MFFRIEILKFLKFGIEILVFVIECEIIEKTKEKCQIRQKLSKFLTATMKK